MSYHVSPQNPTNKKGLKNNFTIILGYNGKVQLVEEILSAKNIINNPERRAGIKNNLISLQYNLYIHS